MFVESPTLSYQLLIYMLEFAILIPNWLYYPHRQAHSLVIDDPQWFVQAGPQQPTHKNSVINGGKLCKLWKKRIQVDGEQFYAHNAAFKMLYLLFLI